MFGLIRDKLSRGVSNNGACRRCTYNMILKHQLGRVSFKYVLKCRPTYRLNHGSIYCYQGRFHWFACNLKKLHTKILHLRMTTRDLSKSCIFPPVEWGGSRESKHSGGPILQQGPIRLTIQCVPTIGVLNSCSQVFKLSLRVSRWRWPIFDIRCGIRGRINSATAVNSMIFVNHNDNGDITIASYIVHNKN